MDDTKSGMSWVWVLFVILVFWAIFGGFGNGFGNRGGCDGGWNGRDHFSSEKQEIIDSATTQHKIEEQGALTRAAVVESGNAIQEQANRIYIQGIQAELFDAKATINKLQSEAFTKDLFGQLSAQSNASFCALNQRLDGIECRMLTKPTLNGVAVTNCGQLVPASACGCGCGNI